jgi:hypothetical protein
VKVDVILDEFFGREEDAEVEVLERGERLKRFTISHLQSRRPEEIIKESNDSLSIWRCMENGT